MTFIIFFQRCRPDEIRRLPMPPNRLPIVMAHPVRNRSQIICKMLFELHFAEVNRNARERLPTELVPFVLEAHAMGTQIDYDYDNDNRSAIAPLTTSFIAAANDPVTYEAECSEVSLWSTGRLSVLYLSGGAKSSGAII